LSTLVHTSAGFGGRRSAAPTDRFHVRGTDLGYLFTGGRGAWVGGVFGDTFNKPDPRAASPVGGDEWRSPVMGRTSNTDFLTRGIVWDNFAGAANTGGTAKQIFPYNHVGSAGRYNSGNFDAFTVIPNDIIQVPDGRYFGTGFRVRDWGRDARQSMCHTISNAWFWSDEPNADSWQVGRYRDNLDRLYEWATGRDRLFQNATFLMLPDDDHLYVFGSREGRTTGTGAEADGVYLRRAHYDDCFTDDGWEYFGRVGGSWMWGRDIDPSPVITPLTPGGPVGELNAQFVAGKVVLTYVESGLGAVALVSDRPDGTWSDPTVLVGRARSPAQYAPSVHPWNNRLEDAYLHLSSWESTPGPAPQTLDYCTRGWRVSLVSGETSTRDDGALSLNTSGLDGVQRERVIARILSASGEVNGVREGEWASR
jgi:hypothetical protein